jgi:signal transduction histidine kinase
LYISKSIVEAHGGKIWAENNGDVAGERRKRGSTFYFSLPIIDESINQSKIKQYTGNDRRR